MYKIQDWIQIESEGIMRILHTNSHLILIHYDGLIELRDLKDLSGTSKKLPVILSNFLGVTVQNDVLYYISKENKIKTWKIDQSKNFPGNATEFAAPYVITASSQYLVLKNEVGIEVIDRTTLRSLGFLFKEASETALSRHFPLSINGNLLLEPWNNDSLRIWNLKTFKVEAELNQKIPYISACTWIQDFVAISTDSCIEDEGPCEIHLWNFKRKKLYETSIKSEEEYYHTLISTNLRHDERDSTWLIGTSIPWIDIWEYDSWKLLSRIETSGDTTASCLIGNTLYTGNMDGVLTKFSYVD